MSHPTIVLKFGSSVLVDEGATAHAVEEIYRWWREGSRVLAVVSAIGDTTDRLWADAHEACETPDEHALAALLATGEARSVALLALALRRSGLAPAVLEPARIGLRTRGGRLDADAVDIDADAVDRLLDRHGIGVLPGFVGVSEDGGTALLGRGGSDLTAVFVAHRLGARCRLLKDVDGLYERDPALPGPTPSRYATISWGDALRLDDGIVQPKAVLYAREHGLTFEVGAVGAARVTLVHGGTTSTSRATSRARPLRVVLIGLGTVGGGVARRLARHDGFELVGVAVRDASRPRDVEAPLVEDASALLALEPDILVEAAGGPDVADVLEDALTRGIDVVSANKSLLADDGHRIAEAALRGGAHLAFSAAVGGAVPALERVRTIAEEETILEISGVLNGTSSYVLDRLAAGAPLDDAVLEAQARGFAEADPSSDLDGRDAAWKLRLLARAAFGQDVVVDRRGIDEIRVPGGAVTRLVATCRRGPDGIEASVTPVTLGDDHVFANLDGEECAVAITTARGTTTVAARGAGRWPTTESVVADVLELSRRSRPDREETAVAARGSDA